MGDRERSGVEAGDIFTGAGGRESRLDPTFRKALRHLGIGPFEDMLRDRLIASWAEIAPGTGYGGGSLNSLEFELNAYGDGAHCGPHIDIPVGKNRRTAGAHEGEDRAISAVYYFYREPKAFSGGALRLYRFGADAYDPASDADSIAFGPSQNTLVCSRPGRCTRSRRSAAPATGSRITASD